MMRNFNLDLSSSAGNKTNCLYPDFAHITSKEDLKKATKKDHVCAKFKRSYRSNDNFVTSNVIALDCDNEDLKLCKSKTDNGEQLVWLPLEEITLQEIKPTFLKESIINNIINEKNIIHIIEERDR